MSLESGNAAPLMLCSLVIVLMQAMAFAGGQEALQGDLISNESFFVVGKSANSSLMI